MRAVANVELATSVFDDIRLKANEIANLVSTEVMTSNSTFGQNIGNANLAGTFCANVIVAKSILRGGLVTGSNAALQFSTDGFTIGNLALHTASRIVTTNADPAQVMDSVPFANYSFAIYSFMVNTANTRHGCKMHLIHDGTNAQLTEFGVLTTNGASGTFSAGQNATHALVLFAPVAAFNNVVFTREVLSF